MYISVGLPIHPRRLVDKMTDWECINLNELIPFCDPKAEEDKEWEAASDRSNSFPSLAWYNQAIKLQYTFLQWANCFVTYIIIWP